MTKLFQDIQKGDMVVYRSVNVNYLVLTGSNIWTYANAGVEFFRCELFLWRNDQKEFEHCPSAAVWFPTSDKPSDSYILRDGETLRPDFKFFNDSRKSKR